MTSGGGSTLIAACLLLVIAGCRGESGDASGTETEGSESSEGSGLEGAEPTGVDVQACEPGQSRACYEGPPGTEDVGVCAAGSQVCTEDGAGWSACAGEVWPEPAERCETQDDDDCDGWAVCEPSLGWAHPIPGTVRAIAMNVAGDVVVAGSWADGEFQGEPLQGTFVLALDAAGELQWARNVVGIGSAVPYEVMVDDAGVVTLVGYYNGSPDPGGGPLPPTGDGAFVTRYDADGSHLWDHAVSFAEYYAAALGADGTTYVAGGNLFEDAEPESLEGSFFVEAIDRSGERAWILLGQGGYGIVPESISVAVTETDELILAAALGGFDLTLGELPIEVDGYQVVVARIGLDGSVLDYTRVPEVAPLSIGAVEVMARPQGLMTAVSVADYDEQGYYEWNAMLTALDPMLQPLSEHRVGQTVSLRGAVAYPNGATVLNLEFSGTLELGPLGPGVPDYLQAPAIAAVDDLGQGRWVEVLYSMGSTEITTIAAAPDGTVVLGGIAYDDAASLAGTTVQGPFLAMLRP